jgi:hypothetical protein
LLVLVMGGVRNHAAGEAAALLALFVVALVVARWLVRDPGAHPANFPEPSASHSLRIGRE